MNSHQLCCLWDENAKWVIDLLSSFVSFIWFPWLNILSHFVYEANVYYSYSLSFCSRLRYQLFLISFKSIDKRVNWIMSPQYCHINKIMFLEMTFKWKVATTALTFHMVPLGLYRTKSNLIVTRLVKHILISSYFGRPLFPQCLKKYLMLFLIFLN